jgi:hypothetical protein
MHEDAMVGVSGDVSRDGGQPSREVVPFTTLARVIPSYTGIGLGLPVSVYSGSDDFFLIGFGELSGGEFQIATTEAGLEAIIGSCQSALVRARIAREAAA